MLWIPLAVVAGYLYVLRRRVIALPANVDHGVAYLKDPAIDVPKGPEEVAKEMHTRGSSATEILAYLGERRVPQERANELLRSFT